MARLLFPSQIFDGEQFHRDTIVVIQEGKILELLPADAVTAKTAPVETLKGTLAPGFIDIQVNGGGGKLFNNSPCVETLQHIADAHRHYGTTGLLPTIISDTPETQQAAVTAVNTAIECNMAGILGIHLEGPYLEDRRRGVHQQEMLRKLSRDEYAHSPSVKLPGLTLQTLAPEAAAPGCIKDLVEMGVIVSLGHSESSYEATLQALNEGATGFTHLYNAMPPMRGRDPGIVAAALTHGESYCGIIVDGHHVHEGMVRLAWQLKTADQLMLVTDAMTTPESVAGEQRLYQAPLMFDGQVLRNSEGSLAGSTLTMDQAVHNAIVEVGIPAQDALRMASLTPAIFLGLDKSYGKIAPGYHADLVLLNEEFRVQNTWVNGIPMH